MSEWRRYLDAAGGGTQQHLADWLGVTRTAVTTAYSKGRIPPTWYLRARAQGISEQWLRTGLGEMHAPMAASPGGLVRDLASCSLAELQQAIAEALSRCTGQPVLVELTALRRLEDRWEFAGHMVEAAREAARRDAPYALVRDPGPGGMPLQKLRVTPVQESPRDYTEDT